MSKIVIETGSDITNITTGEELNLVADEFYTYCMRMNLGISEAERMSNSLAILVPDFLKSHGFKPFYKHVTL